VANTFVGMMIDVAAARPYIANVTAGLSGPAIRPIVVRMVYQIAGWVRIPIVGVGGVTCLRDALEYFMAGATAVQVGTANFVNPNTGVEIVDGLGGHLRERGLASVTELVGAARRASRDSLAVTVE
jgi:dihydroorotate dehydrogenase (NAD+) catalytic subunit